MIVSAIPTNSSDRQLRHDLIKPDLIEKILPRYFQTLKLLVYKIRA